MKQTYEISLQGQLSVVNCLLTLIVQTWQMMPAFLLVLFLGQTVSPVKPQLLVQPIDRDEYVSARLHRYAGVIRKSMGVKGQCCIPNCTRIFPLEQANEWKCSCLKEDAK